MDSEIKNVLKQYPEGKREDLIACMQSAQDQIGCINEAAIKEISEHFKIAGSKVYSLASFYDYFSFEPKGKIHVKICNGTACHLQGANHLAKEAEKHCANENKKLKKGQRVSVQTTECMGTCSKGPLVSINDKLFTNVESTQIDNLIKQVREENE